MHVWFASYYVDLWLSSGGLLLTLCLLKNMKRWRKSNLSLSSWIWFLGIQGICHCFFVSFSFHAFIFYFSSIVMGHEHLKWNFNTHTHIASASLLQNICWFVQDSFWPPGISDCICWSVWHAHDAGIVTFWCYTYISLLSHNILQKNCGLFGLVAEQYDVSFWNIFSYWLGCCLIG